MALQTLPNNVPNCLATLLSLVDDICYHTGDRSVDVSYHPVDFLNECCNYICSCKCDFMYFF